MPHLKILNTCVAVVTLGIAGMANVATAVDITGAGATFPYPVYAKWAEAYKAKVGTGLNYQSIGSGGGIKQIEASTVDFGASDMPLSPETLQQNGLLQFPTVIGGAVPVAHLDNIGSGELKLTGAILADIYLGKITKWNDPAIVALNKGIVLPAEDITVVHRSDGSGTTFIWSNYLSKVSPEWKTKVGEGTSLSWPAGVGGKGNEGVASYVQRIYGSIGYVEYAYALQNKMTTIALQNKRGQFVQPSAETFAAAAAGADWKNAAGFYLLLTDQSGKNSWPISGATFILMHKVQEKPEIAKEVVKFFGWSQSSDGAKLAMDLGYVPLPNTVTNLIKTEWKEELKDKSGNPVY